MLVLPTDVASPNADALYRVTWIGLKNNSFGPTGAYSFWPTLFAVVFGAYANNFFYMETRTNINSWDFNSQDINSWGNYLVVGS